MLFDTQGDTYLVNAFHQLFASANLKSHSQHSTSFQSLHKTWVKTTLLLYRSCHWKSNTGRLHRICNYWIFLLMMPFTFLFNTFDVNGGALLFLAKYVTRNWTDWQDTQAVLFLLTLPHISFFLLFWAKYVTKNCASRRYTQIMSGQGHNMVILLFL